MCVRCEMAERLKMKNCIQIFCWLNFDQPMSFCAYCGYMQILMIYFAWFWIYADPYDIFCLILDIYFDIHIVLVKKKFFGYIYAYSSFVSFCFIWFAFMLYIMEFMSTTVILLLYSAMSLWPSSIRHKFKEHLKFFKIIFESKCGNGEDSKSWW